MNKTKKQTLFPEEYLVRIENMDNDSYPLLYEDVNSLVAEAKNGEKIAVYKLVEVKTFNNQPRLD